MPGRGFDAGSGYRYGFNGKENDKDISGGGQDYGMRIYDSRLGKFLSVDPLTRDYSWNSNYAFAENNVISCIDLEGLEKYFSADGSYLGKYGTSQKLYIVKSDEVKSASAALAMYKNNPQAYNKTKASGYLQFYLPSLGSSEAYESSEANERKVLGKWAKENRGTKGERVMSLFTSKIDSPDGKSQMDVFVEGTTGEGPEYSRGGAVVSLAASQTSFTDWKRSTTIHTHLYGGPLEFSNELEGAFSGGDLQRALSIGINLYLVPQSGSEMGKFDVNKFKKLVRSSLENQSGGEYFKKMSDAQIFSGVGPIGDPYYSIPEAKSSMEKVKIENP